jgi:hypothetical protein
MRWEYGTKKMLLEYKEYLESLNYSKKEIQRRLKIIKNAKNEMELEKALEALKELKDG